MQTFILTNYETYTDAEVVDLFSEHVKPENLEVLVIMTRLNLKMRVELLQNALGIL